MSNPALHSTLNWLIDRRRWLLGSAIVLGILGAIVGRDLKMDRSLERLFAANDPLLVPYNKLQKAFGQHQIVLAIYRDEQLSSTASLARVKQLADEAGKIRGVVSVVSIHDVPGLLEDDGTAIKSDDRAAMLKSVFAGYTHNETLDAAGIICLIGKSSESSTPTRETLADLRELVDPLPGGALIGEPVLIGEAFDLLEADGRRLNTWCLALLLATIYACFRQVRWLVLPLVLVQVTLALTRGLLVLLDLELSMISSMLAAIVTVVGIAAVMHVIVRYRDARLAGYEPRQALLRAGELVAAPLFYACLTDALGFAALMTSSVKPVVDFGLMMAIGSMMVLVVIALVSPAIVLYSRETVQILPEPGASRLHIHLHAVYEWSIRNAWLLGTASLVITVVTFIGSARLEQETDFTRNFRQDSELVKGYQFVDEKFGGAGVWDILIPAPARLGKKFVTQVLEFEDQLRQHAPRLTKVTSLADILDAGTGGLRRMRLGGDMAVRGGLALMRARLPNFVAAIHNPNAPSGERYLRIMLRAPERLGAEQKAALIDQVEDTTQKHYPGTQVTGYYVLFTHLIESLLRDQWVTFGVATVGIFLVMAWAFRSLPLSIVTLIPNVLPVFWLFGAMGWLGLKINMGAAMIAAVSVGLSVDGSIHYVMSYQRLRREGHSRDDALRTVQGSVGRAAVLATLALMVGFSTLCVSEFIPTVYFGSLVSLTMVGGLVGNLVALPLLIRVVER